MRKTEDQRRAALALSILTPRSVLLGLVALVAVAGSASVLLHGAESENQYITAPVEHGDLVTNITATGTVNATVMVKVGSQLSGQIDQLLVDFNDEVEQGQPIAKLDPQTFAARVREAEAALEIAEAQVRIKQADVKRAEAELATARSHLAVVEARAEGAGAKAEDAQSELQRSRVLLERRTIAQSVVDRSLAEYRSSAALLRAAEAEYQVQRSTIQATEAALTMAEADEQNARAMVKQRRAALEGAEVDLARTVIRAPIDGTVVGRDVDRGQTVAASLEAPTLFTIAQDLREMEVHAKVDEADIGRIRVGQSATFTVDAYPDQVFEGAVVQIRKAAQIMQNVVTYTVVISADNPDFALLPGMTSIVWIVVERMEGVLKVPNAALRFQPPESVSPSTEADVAATEITLGTPAVVWTPSAQGKIVPVAIGTGGSDASATELLMGPLGAGDLLIVGVAPKDHGTWFLGIQLGS